MTVQPDFCQTWLLVFSCTGSYVSSGVVDSKILYYRVIALISVYIVPSLDIEGRELARTIFTDISAITLLLYSYKYLLLIFDVLLRVSLTKLKYLHEGRDNIHK